MKFKPDFTTQQVVTKKGRKWKGAVSQIPLTQLSGCTNGLINDLISAISFPFISALTRSYSNLKLIQSVTHSTSHVFVRRDKSLTEIKCHRFLPISQDPFKTITESDLFTTPVVQNTKGVRCKRVWGAAIQGCWEIFTFSSEISDTLKFRAFVAVQ